MKLIPRHYVEEIRWHTKELTKVLQEYAYQGEKTALPDDDELRQKFCAYNLRVSRRILRAVETSAQSLQAEIDLLEQLYLKQTKTMRKVMVKELDALEEEIRYFQAMFDAEMFVNKLHDRVLECEIELSRLERRKLSNSVRKSTKTELIFMKVPAIKEDYNVLSHTEKISVVNSPPAAVDKLQQDFSKTVISSSEGNDQSLAVAKAKSSQDIRLEKADPGKENKKSCDRIDRCNTNRTPSASEVPSQVMSPTATAKVETTDFEDGKSITSNLTMSIQRVNVPRINRMCHIRCTNFNISIESCLLQPSVSCSRHNSYFAEPNTVKAIRAAHQRPLLYPDKQKNWQKNGVDI